MDDIDYPKREIMGYTLVETCGACPEQYDVYKDGEMVGYLRLRHGSFTVDAPFGNTIWTGHPRGDGLFEPDERDGYLELAIHMIELHSRGVWKED